MRFPLFAAAFSAALLAGCATEGPYYGGYAYDYGYYGPDYYGPSYFSFYYRGGDGDHQRGWSGGTRSWQQGSVQVQPRSPSPSVSQPRIRSGNHQAQGGARAERHERAARQSNRQSSRIAQRPAPEREHGG